MNYVGVKVMLEHGHYLALVLPNAEANQLIDRHSAGSLPPRIYGVLGPEWGNTKYSFDAAHVVALHTFDPSILKSQPQQQELPRWARGSGLN